MIYQTADDISSSASTFIYTYNNNVEGTDTAGQWQVLSNPVGTSGVKSHLPAGTTEVAIAGGSGNAFGLNDDVDNAFYDMNRSGAITTGTKEQWLAAIHNPANWITTDANAGYDLTPGGANIPANGALNVVWSVRDRMVESLSSYAYDSSNMSNGATLGTLDINFNFEYLSGASLENIFFEITVANNAFLQNADGGPGGLSANLFIANGDLPDVISPTLDLFDETETLIVPFKVGISGAPWGLNFAIYSNESSAVAANRTPLTTFTIDSSMVGLESSPQMAPSIFLPLTQ